MTKLVLVGESNPYGGDPEFALYPAPDGCSGHRLCVHILGMTRRDYLDSFDRVNLVQGVWDNWQAAVSARLVVGEKLVLLGSKVAVAFGLKPDPFTRVVLSYSPARAALMLPHPSGLCRVWNDPAAAGRARKCVEEFAPELAGRIGRIATS